MSWNSMRQLYRVPVLVLVLNLFSSTGAIGQQSPTLTIVPQYSDYGMKVTWVFCVSAFDDNYDLRYKGKEYLKIGMARSFINEQDRLRRGNTNACGYVYSIEGREFVSQIDSISMRGELTRLLTGVKLYQIYATVDKQDYTLVYNVAMDPDSQRRIWYRQTKGEVEYRTFGDSELVPSGYEPVTFVGLLELDGYDNKPACPQLYDHTLQRAINTDKYFHVWGAGVAYTIPASESGSDKKMSKNYALMFVEKTAVTKSQIKMSTIALYGSGDVEYDVQRIPAEFHRNVRVIESELMKKGVGLILSEVSPNTLNIREEYVEPHTIP
ncbi:MAG: hypothetical protein R3F48_16280 [Candidatus Zixiibacteriota bacterium]